MVIAEFFAPSSGLGAIIINSANNFDAATMFVPIVVLMAMAIGLNGLIGLIERRVAPWQAEIAGRDREEVPPAPPATILSPAAPSNSRPSNPPHSPSPHQANPPPPPHNPR